METTATQAAEASRRVYVDGHTYEFHLIRTVRPLNSRRVAACEQGREVFFSSSLSVQKIISLAAQWAAMTWAEGMGADIDDWTWNTEPRFTVGTQVFRIEFCRANVGALSEVDHDARIVTVRKCSRAELATLIFDVVHMVNRLWERWKAETLLRCLRSGEASATRSVASHETLPDDENRKLVDDLIEAARKISGQPDPGSKPDPEA